MSKEVFGILLAWKGIPQLALYNSLVATYIPTGSNLAYRAQMNSFQKPWITENLSVVQQTHNSNIAQRVQLKLFVPYLTFSHSTTETLYKVHSANQLWFYQVSLNSLLPSLNINKLYAQWTHLYQLLFNTFINQSKVITFANKFLKFETNALNYATLGDSLMLLNYNKTFFLSKEATYSEVSSLMFQKLLMKEMPMVCILDINSFSKTNFFLKKWGTIVVGLVPYSMNPWLVNYPILVSGNNLTTQYYFLKLFSYIRQEAQSRVFNTSTQHWLS